MHSALILYAVFNYIKKLGCFNSLGKRHIKCGLLKRNTLEHKLVSVRFSVSISFFTLPRYHENIVL